MSANQEQTQVPTPNQGEAKNQKTKSIQRQKDDPIGYNPGGEKLMISAKTVKRNMAFGRLLIDPEVFPNLAIAGSSASYPVHTKTDPDAHRTRLEWTELWTQLVSATAFKQFCYSLKPDYAYVSDHYGRAVSKRLSVPSGLLPIVRQYGTVFHETGNWEVIGQPILVSTMLLRGVGEPVEMYAGVNQAVNRRDSIGFDPSMPRAWEFLLEWAKGTINQWCHVNSVVINVDGHISNITGVQLTDGFEVFYTAFQTTQFPPHVMRAFRIGHQAEWAVAQNPIPVGANVPAGVVNALNAERVVVFRWVSDDVERRFAGYYSQVQAVMGPTFDELYAMTEISVMMNRGTTSQLITRSNPENAYAPIDVDSAETQFGTMLSTDKTGASRNEPLFRVEADHTPLDMVVHWFEGMKRGGRKLRRD